MAIIKRKIMSLEKKLEEYLQSTKKRFKLERKRSEFDREIALLTNNSGPIVHAELAEKVIKLVDKRNSVEEQMLIAEIEQSILASDITNDLAIFGEKSVIVETHNGSQITNYVLKVTKTDSGNSLDCKIYNE
jgi:hypothetical protein